MGADTHDYMHNTLPGMGGHAAYSFVDRTPMFARPDHCPGEEDDDEIRREDTPEEEKAVEVVWVNQRYDPNNPRKRAPVQRAKFSQLNTRKPLPHIIPVPNEWRLPVEPGMFEYCRRDEEPWMPILNPARRSEEWSCLRQMLPTRLPTQLYGERELPPRWGTSHDVRKGTQFEEYSPRGTKKPVPPPTPGHRPVPSRFPQITSTMSRFVDEMHRSNEQFKMF